MTAAEPGTVTLRYWAAAKAAAGTAEQRVDLATLPAATLADLLGAVTAEHGAGLGKVLTVCSFLVDEHPVGTRPHAQVALPAGALVDVLPPFAGG